MLTRDFWGKSTHKQFVLAKPLVIGAYAARPLVLKTPDPTPLAPSGSQGTCATVAPRPDEFRAQEAHVPWERRPEDQLQRSQRTRLVPGNRCAMMWFARGLSRG